MTLALCPSLLLRYVLSLFSFISFFPLHCLGYIHQAGFATGASIDPPHLPWMVYAYGPYNFTRERAMGQVVSSPSFLSFLFFSCIS